MKFEVLTKVCVCITIFCEVNHVVRWVGTNNLEEISGEGRDGGGCFLNVGTYLSDGARSG